MCSRFGGFLQNKNIHSHFSHNAANLPWSMTVYRPDHKKEMMLNNLCQELWVVPVGFCIMHLFNLIFCELPLIQYIFISAVYA